MIKRIFLTALLVIGAILSSFADNNRIQIFLDNTNHPKETYASDVFNIIVTLKEVDDNYDNADVTIELENRHDKYSLLLFKNPYSEKSLKKNKISIDKSFPRDKDKTKPIIQVCSGVNQDWRLDSNEKYTFRKTSKGNEPIVCSLPIYIAKKKNKKGSKISIWELEVKELEIQVEIIDEKYNNIVASYNSLVKEIESVTFCTNKNHKGEPLESLKGKFNSRIESLKNEIQTIIKNRGYWKQDDGRKKFNEILNNLNNITFKTVDSCSNDRKATVSGHKCKYCSLTYEQIYKELENYYIDIRNGESTKAEVMPEVESLYTCVSKNTKRSANNIIKSRITTYYNRIKSFVK